MVSLSVLCLLSLSAGSGGAVAGGADAGGAGAGGAGAGGAGAGGGGAGGAGAGAGGAGAGDGTAVPAAAFFLLPPLRGEQPSLAPWAAPLVALLEQHQLGAGCSAAAAASASVLGERRDEISPSAMGGTLSSEGLGSLAFFLASRLSVAVAQSRQLVLEDALLPYGGPREAEDGRFAAAFLPLSACAAADVPRLASQRLTSAPGGTPTPTRAELLASVPVASSGHGFRSWWAALMAFALRPARGMQLELERYFNSSRSATSLPDIAAAEWTNPHLLQPLDPHTAGVAIGVHVRVGDKPLPQQRPWAAYLAACRGIAARTGALRLVVASDDPATREAARALIDFAVLVVPVRVELQHRGVSMARQLFDGPPSQRSAGTADAIAALYALASTHYLVGSCTSLLLRAAAALQDAHGRRLASPVAVDGLGCHSRPVPPEVPVCEGFVAAVEGDQGEEDARAAREECGGGRDEL